MKKLISFIVSFVFISFSAYTQSYKWSSPIGGTGEDVAVETVTDASGNTITTGYFSGTVDFDPGTGTANRTSKGVHDIFILKLDPSGNLLWVNTFGSTDFDEGSSVTIDASNNIYVSGYYSDTIDFDPGAGIYKLGTYGPGHDHVFVLKLTSAGNFVWAIDEMTNQFSPSVISNKTSVKLDNSGNVFLAFNYDTKTCIFVEKYNNSGVKQWEDLFIISSSSSTIYDPAIVTDGSGNVIVSGTLFGQADLDPTSGVNYKIGPGIFIEKLSGTNGTAMWVKTIIGDPFTSGYAANHCMATDASGNLYLGGEYASTVDFDPDAGTANHTSRQFNSDGFLLKLTSSGVFAWVADYSYNGTAIVSGIETDASGNVYTTGYIDGQVDFLAGVFPFKMVTPKGNKDGFILKLSSSGGYIWVKQIGSTLEDKSQDIAVTAAGDIYTVGYFSGACDIFNPAVAVMANNGNQDMYVLKMNNCSVDTSVSLSGSTLSSATSGASYQWLSCPSKTTISGATGSSYTPTVSGNYAVAINAGGCKDTSGCHSVTVIPGGVYNIVKDEVGIYPNPTNNEITVDLDKAYDNVTIEIKSVVGNTVYKQALKNTKQINATIDGPNGIYMVFVNAGANKTIYRKVIKAD